MQKSSILWIFAALLFIGFKTFWNRSHPVRTAPVEIAGTNLTGPDSGPCENKEHCILYYVAPWCPVCEQTTPVALEIGRLSQTATYGLKIIVGGDTAEKCQKKVEKIGASAQVDANNQLAQQFGISSYPTWIVLDGAGKEVRRISAGFQDPSQAALVVREALKL